MKKAVALASLASVLLAAPATAEKIVRRISFSALKAEGRLASGEVVPKGSGSRDESLRVENPGGAPRTIPLFTIDSPGVAVPRYLLAGEVRGEGIEGRAYLEMWSFFAGGGRYFSRTLADVGPMGSLGGTFDFRPFMLPFTAEPGMKLERLAVNVVLPGRGTVSLAKLTLEELDRDEYFFPTGAWLTPRQISLFGGVGGSILGLLGALVGVLASRGRARALVLGLLKGMFGLGVVALVAAVFAQGLAQPPQLLAIFLLLGVLCTVLPVSLFGRVRRQYDERELRRMRALDAG